MSSPPLDAESDEYEAASIVEYVSMRELDRVRQAQSAHQQVEPVDKIRHDEERGANAEVHSAASVDTHALPQASMQHQMPKGGSDSGPQVLLDLPPPPTCSVKPHPPLGSVLCQLYSSVIFDTKWYICASRAQ